jgi:hypothetical protein
MRAAIRVIPKASRNKVQEESGSLKVYVTKPAQDGLANDQVLELLAKYLKVKKYQLKIIQGEKSRNKVIEVDI